MKEAAAPSLCTWVQSWAPGPLVDQDPLHSGPIAALSAVLDLSDAVVAAGDPLPPLWQWLYFHKWPAQSDLGADGHPRNGHFLPPIPNRQRMWAGGSCEMSEPLRLGVPAECIRSLSNMTVRHGRTGEMLFVTERREFRQQGRICLIEEQEIVYRSGSSTARHPAAIDGSAEARTGEPWQLMLRPDPALLFRFSALTANAHRIHYDAPYCETEEGYPGLVVHGPLMALLMLELPRRHAPDRKVRAVAFRFQRPVFAGESIVACGTPSGRHADLRIATHRDGHHAAAKVAFA
jgi:3-methylfumaryl-CoA hydratase